MTRLKQPDPEFYPSNVRSLVSRLDPRNKIRLFERHSLQPWFKASEEQVLREIRDDIWNESVGMVVYEGRFGASPREIRGILNRASQNHQHPELTTMAIFDELERIVKDRTVYEFLQFEPRGKYHDAALFIEVIKDEFADIFAQEIQTAMALVEEGEYEKLLARYIDHVVAFVKREKIFNPASESYEAPSEAMMKEVEQIIGVQGAADRHREGLLAKIASWKLENRDKPVQINFIFENILRKIQDHYHERKSTVVTANYRAMLMLDTDDARNLKDAETKTAELTYSNLEKMFGYTRTMARKSLTFLLAHQKEKGK
jgi:predicted Ser/Thr protein kinase